MTITHIRSRSCIPLFFFFLLSVLAFPQGQETAPSEVTLDSAIKATVVKGVGRQLVDHYIFPETAEKMDAHLKAQLDQGKYDAIKDVQTFAGILTRDLRSISKDKHIRVTFDPEAVRRIRAGESRDEKDRERERKAALERERRRNFGFRRLEILEGNIGYLELTGFSGSSEAAETITAAMNFLAESDAVIIDLRGNGGGSPFTIQIISSYFLKEYTHLNSFEWRGDDTIKQFWTLRHVPGKKLYDTDLYILTSPRTFSAAEEFTYNLKNLKRATIVGETTGGGAHPGGARIVNDSFLVWVPSGRAINPITGTNWEGTGIEPHIKVNQMKALDTAHQKALEKIAGETNDPEHKRGLQWALDGLKARLEPAEVDEEMLRKYVGTYSRGEAFVKEGRLFFKTGYRAFPLIPLRDNYFVLEGWDAMRIEFVEDETGGGYVIRGHRRNGAPEISRRVDTD